MPRLNLRQGLIRYVFLEVCDGRQRLRRTYSAVKPFIQHRPVTLVVAGAGGGDLSCLAGVGSYRRVFLCRVVVGAPGLRRVGIWARLRDARRLQAVLRKLSLVDTATASIIHVVDGAR